MLSIDTYIYRQVYLTAFTKEADLCHKWRLLQSSLLVAPGEYMSERGPVLSGMCTVEPLHPRLREHRGMGVRGKRILMCASAPTSEIYSCNRQHTDSTSWQQCRD